MQAHECSEPREQLMSGMDQGASRLVVSRAECHFSAVAAITDAALQRRAQQSGWLKCCLVVAPPRKMPEQVRGSRPALPVRYSPVQCVLVAMGWAASNRTLDTAPENVEKAWGLNTGRGRARWPVTISRKYTGTAPAPPLFGCAASTRYQRVPVMHRAAALRTRSHARMRSYVCIQPSPTLLRPWRASGWFLLHFLLPLRGCS